MLKNNAFKTSLMFLAIILFALVFRMFMSGDALVINLDDNRQAASTYCTDNTKEC